MSKGLVLEPGRPNENTLLEDTLVRGREVIVGGEVGPAHVAFSMSLGTW